MHGKRNSRDYTSIVCIIFFSSPKAVWAMPSNRIPRSVSIVLPQIAVVGGLAVEGDDNGAAPQTRVLLCEKI